MPPTLDNFTLLNDPKGSKEQLHLANAYPLMFLMVFWGFVIAVNRYEKTTLPTIALLWG